MGFEGDKGEVNFKTQEICLENYLQWIVEGVQDQDSVF
jgi:hypothetical protein